MKPRHTAEQSTIRVNKAEKIGKKGFAGVARTIIKEIKTEEIEIGEIKRENIPEKFIPEKFEKVGGIEKIVSERIIQEKIILENIIPEKIIKEREFAPIISNIPNKFTDLSSIIIKKETDSIKVCPIDPAERAQCDSCQ